MTLEYTSPRTAARPLTQTDSAFRRIAAFFIDGPYWFMLAGVFEHFTISRIRYMPDRLQIAIYIAFYLAFPAYLSMEIFTFATVGKLATGVRVATITGGRLSLAHGCFRWMLKSCPWLIRTGIVILDNVSPHLFIPRYLADFIREITEPSIHLFLMPLQWLPDSAVAIDRYAVEAFMYSGVKFLAEGWWLLWMIILGQSLVFNLDRRTLIDRLSRTTVFQTTPTRHRV